MIATINQVCSKTPRRRIRQALRFPLIGLLAATCLVSSRDSTAQDIVVRATELDIASVHRGFERGDFDCVDLVRAYLARIETYDDPQTSELGLNSIARINDHAMERALELDQTFASAGLSGPLHCIPFAVKENYDTHDMPTSAGSLSLAESTPPDDAFQVSRIRAAGAIIIAKTHMAEFAFSPYETLSSLGHGHTLNPYDPSRVPAGSSGGTAAAVAANLALVGLGTDTGNSIRGPSSHTALVGLRSTMGATSRDGIIPLNLFRDIGGPMAKSVTDATIVFDVIAGHDPADPVTAPMQERRPTSYLDFLQRDGARNKRIGVIRELAETDESHPEVLEHFERALVTLESLGATIVDPASLPLLSTIEGLWCNPFRAQLEDYLETLGPEAPRSSLQAILDSGAIHPSIRERIISALGVEKLPEDECQSALDASARLRDAVVELFERHRLDAVAYPSWSHPARRLGDLNSPHGNNSPRISPPTGFPAITVPMGTVGALPVGLQLLSPAFEEGVLIEIAFAFEQRTHHRRPPETTPPLRN